MMSPPNQLVITRPELNTQPLASTCIPELIEPTLAKLTVCELNSNGVVFRAKM